MSETEQKHIHQRGAVAKLLQVIRFREIDHVETGKSQTTQKVALQAENTKRLAA